MDSAAFRDKRSRQYDDAVKKHDPPFDKTIARTRTLLSGSDVVLDFGCGSGEFGVELAPDVQKLHGIDASAEMINLAIEKAKERRTNNAFFDQMDLFECSLTTGSFSSAIAFSILHLVDDAQTALARLGDLLERGGLLISETPCFREKSWLFTSLIILAQKIGLMPKIRCFSRAELELLVPGSGFEILESELWDWKSSSQWIIARKTRAS